LSILIKNQAQKDLKPAKLIDFITEGDEIKIYIGYNDNNRLEFEGYIKRINEKLPLELELEDELYLLRRTYLKKNFKVAPVKDVLNYILDNLYSQQGLRLYLQPDAQLPNMKVNNFYMKEGCTGIQALQALQDCTVVLHSYLVTLNGKKTLYCGLVYGLQLNTINYVFRRNTIDINDLKYNRPEDRTFKVNVRWVKSNGKVKQYTFGDPHGDLNKVEIQGDHWSDASINTYAQGVLSGLKSGGYKGSFTTFLLPNAQPGDIANITDPQFPARSGKYYISSVETTFGNGARRKIGVEIKVN
jgi:hypothetical protein